jgi:hypothetical protein
MPGQGTWIFVEPVPPLPQVVCGSIPWPSPLRICQEKRIAVTVCAPA